MGIGQWFRIVTGLVEILGALALLIPRSAPAGGVWLGVTMAFVAVPSPGLRLYRRCRHRDHTCRPRACRRHGREGRRAVRRRGRGSCGLGWRRGEQRFADHGASYQSSSRCADRDSFGANSDRKDQADA
ncbi:DoxX family protein [Bradyrhizobium erythrophlei]|uniref:DoxX family protein n=1 Tax=Bradyrhizobium erythrophlei TaxID=1437360 RepID=UPI0023EA4D68|nr:DoxX family protein [Bradyrhizobium erythrophlei]